MLAKIIELVFLIILAGLIFIGELPLPDTRETVQESFSQFIAQYGTDEYVVASQKTNETFVATTEFGLFDIDAEISLVAYYKFHIKMAELKYHVENGVVFVEIPRLYLSTPVAFNFDTVHEKCNGLLGLKCEKLLQQLKQNVSSDLVGKGLHQIPSLYNIAAKSLADNLNNYFAANGHNYYYKSIVISFIAEGSKSQRQFNYNTDFCEKEPCLLKLKLNKLGG